MPYQIACQTPCQKVTHPKIITDLLNLFFNQSSNYTVDWKVEEDDYICIYSVLLPYLDSATFMAPSARLNEGFFWMCVMRKDASKADLVRVMLALETGEHVKVPHVDMVRARAFRLEPLDNEGSHKGHLTVDGETVKLGPIQATAERAAIRYLSKRF